MKKQGMPEPLDESLVTRKRKDAPVAVDPERKKRSRTAAREAREAKAKATPKTRVAGKPVNPTKTAAAIVNAAKAKGKVAKAAPPPSDEEDDLSEDDSDLMDEDNINVTGLDALGSASEGEESIDEDEFDSDVVDSDTEIRKTAMWSDDEDDEDAEEKLTAANIAGLSRKLDEQKAVEEAEAQAELEENMLQTNIVGERPKILEDEEDEDGRPITNLVSQDIQLLRTRLTDTIRVLDDFKNLGEEGRSRAEYRASLLRDICAYYGMLPTREVSQFLDSN
jgi:ribosomal RNA methyltransferase Nop2